MLSHRYTRVVRAEEPDRAIPRGNDAGGRAGLVLMFLTPSDLQSLRVKGVEHLVTERDEGGFFSRVLTIHPVTRVDRCEDLGPVHRVMEYGPVILQRWSKKFRWLRLLQAPLVIARLAWELPRVARRERVSLIRATDPYLVGILAFWIHVMTGVPYVISIHADYDHLDLLDPRRGAPRILGSRVLAESVARLVLPRAALVLPIRDSLRAFALRRGAHAESMALIPHGIDLRPYAQPSTTSLRAQLDIAPGIPIISFAGRLSPENYVDDLLEIILLLARERSDFVFVAAGGGPSEEAMRRRIPLDLARRVRLVGFQAQEFIRGLRSESLVSVCLMGGFSLIEAYAAGSAVIAYAVDWHGELVIEGETGHLVPEHDIARAKACLSALLDNPVTARSMGLAGRSLVRERHGLDLSRQKKVDAYSRALSVPRTG